jgi:hypothetical protein
MVELTIVLCVFIGLEGNAQVLAIDRIFGLCGVREGGVCVDDEKHERWTRGGGDRPQAHFVSYTGREMPRLTSSY